ncbi:MAG: DUF3619 family protein [Betaproteobacteria bacterium]|jgi:hypothetical protein
MNALNTSHPLLDHHGSLSIADEEMLAIDQIGKIVAKTLENELKHISPKALSRLEGAREMALAKQKLSKTPLKSPSVSKALTKSPASFFNSKLSNLGSLLPMIVLILGIFLITQWQQTARLNDIADVDAALLSDEVPPDAYADDGFRLFMKNLMLHNPADSGSDSQTSSSSLDNSSH